MNTFKDRLNIAIEYAETDQSKLAKAIGVTPQSIQYLCKKGSASKHLNQIANVLKVNPDWLAEGVGDMPARDKQAPPIIDLKEWQGLNPKLRAFVEDTIDKYKSNKITTNDITFLHLMADKFSASNEHAHA